MFGDFDGVGDPMYGPAPYYPEHAYHVPPPSTGNGSSTTTGTELDASSPEDNGINSKQIWSALKQSVINNFGDTGWGAVSSSLTSTFRAFRALRLG